MKKKSIATSKHRTLEDYLSWAEQPRSGGETMYTDGYCPQCLLDADHQEMTLNTDDFWECPKCQLQAHSASSGFLAILTERGHGHLKTEKAISNRQVIGVILTRGQYEFPEGPSIDPRGFRSEEELREFLLTVKES